jgi:uncharacterized protein YgiM (DUF1202 family)
LTASWSQQFKAGYRGAEGVSAATVASDTPPAPVAPLPLPAPAAPEPLVPTAYVTVDLLNVRQGPDTSYPIIERIANGSAHPIAGRLSNVPDWWFIAVGDKSGWIFGPLIEARGPLDAIPQLDLQTATSTRKGAGPLPISGQIGLHPFLSRSP